MFVFSGSFALRGVGTLRALPADVQSIDLFPSVSSPVRHSIKLPRAVLSALGQRGIAVGPVPGEDPARADLRLDTALMALFRDTRLNVAFEALYLRSRRALHGWIVHLLAQRGQETDPSELLQDTYVNVYRYAGGFRDEGGNTFRGWIRTIAANVVRRARVRRGPVVCALPSEVHEPADQRGGPERQAVVTEQRAALSRAWLLLLLHYGQAFQKLSPRDREALRLVEVEGLSYAEAGERLQVGRSNMKMIMFRSRKRIRAHILRAMLGDMETIRAAS